eukprot:215400-Rhodomonas_salina.2
MPPRPRILGYVLAMSVLHASSAFIHLTPYSLQTHPAGLATWRPRICRTPLRACEGNPLIPAGMGQTHQAELAYQRLQIGQTPLLACEVNPVIPGGIELARAVCLSVFCWNLFFAPTAALALEELQPQSYYQQLRDAMPLKTMRGIWKYKEVKDGKVCDGTLTFRGQLDNPNRGDVVFDGGSNSCYSPIPPVKAIKGKWLMKPA